MAKCKSCGAEIVWVKTSAGKDMPLSVATKQKRYAYVHLIPGDVAFQFDTYLSHFADCPNAAQHRKPKDASTS